MQSIEPQPKLVLFDLDDTLAATSSARLFRLRVAFERAFSFAGEAVSADLDAMAAESVALNEHGVEHFEELLSQHGLDHSSAAKQAQNWYLGNRFYGVDLFPDALEMIVAVREAVPGRNIGMITNGPEDIQGPKIELLELQPYFDFILISGAFGAHKPDPSIFEAALRLGNATPADAIHIGDLPEYDILGAHNAGIPSIWMNHSGAPWPDGMAPPTYQAASLRDVQSLLGAA